MNKSKARNLRSKLLVFVLFAVLVVSAVISMKSFDTLTANAESLDLSASRTEILEKAFEVNAQLAEEGMILLRNEMVGTEGNLEPALPVATSVENKAKISVFGINVNNPVYTGGGSAGTVVGTTINPYMALESANYEINPTLRSFYGTSGGRQANPGMSLPSSFYNGERAYSAYTEPVIESYAEYNDMAVVFICRIGGEGFDLARNTGLHADYTGTAPAGQNPHYLMLDTKEKDLLRQIKASGQFKRVVLLLNVSAQMQLDFLDDAALAPDAILYVSTPGSRGFAAVGKILNGTVNPSAKTVDTYYRNFSADPTFQNFGNNSQVTTETAQYKNSSGSNQSRRFGLDYEEGIYVGYRYYETRGFTERAAVLANNPEATEAEQYAWYNNAVIYPFGHGLSYTSFTQEIVGSSLADGQALTKDGKFTIDVKVTNTGSKPGKDVVELYVNAPYNPGGIEKAHVTLAAFEKTKILAAGAEQILTLKVNVRDLASYDFKTAKCYVLESGSYNFLVGRDAHKAWAATTPIKITYTVPAGGFEYRESLSGGEIKNRFDDVSDSAALIAGQPDQSRAIKNNLMSRTNFAGTFPDAPLQSEMRLTAAQLAGLGHASLTTTALANAYDEGKPWYNDTAPTQATTAATGTNVKDRIILGDLVDVPYEDSLWDEFLNQWTQAQLTSMLNGSYSTAAQNIFGVPNTRDPDGPVGINQSGVSSVKYVSEVIVAATWNKELAFAQGEAIGKEGNANGINGIYGPAMNIHRSPFSGRFFEYYSECGTMSGFIGASVVAGMRSRGMISFIKHYALNDQETHRTEGLCTWSDEQTMREIYFKPFQMSVEIGGSLGFMSSFNNVGPIPASSSWELLTGLPRGEWGFRGVVVTDMYGTNYGHDPKHLLRSGNDLALGTMGAQAVTSNTEKNCLRTSVKNILYAVSRSSAMLRYNGESKINSRGLKGFSYNYTFDTASMVLYNATYTVGYALDGELPAGLTYNAATRTISGTPAETGEFELTLLLTSTQSTTTTLRSRVPFTLKVEEPTLQEQIDEALKQCADLEKQCADLEAALAALEGKFSSLETALMGLIENLQQTIATLENRIAALEAAAETTKPAWLTGTTAPDALLGNNGDTYFNSSTGDVYGKAEGVWSLLINLNGEDGAPGTNGKSAYEIAVDNGFVGTEDEWLASLKGDPGTPGTSGTNGKSAYEIAVDNGFIGTELEWIASLKGADGTPADLSNITSRLDALETAISGLQTYNDTEVRGLITALQGLVTGLRTDLNTLTALVGDGGGEIDLAAILDRISALEAEIEQLALTPGADGKSAYEIAVDEGFVGSVEQWLESLKGETGAQGPQGENGATGPQGPQGENGANGKGVASIAKTTSGNVDTYTITYTDSTTYTFTVTNGTNGAPGADGKGIVSLTKTTEGLVDTYTITYTDSTTSTFTVTNGTNGTNGTSSEITIVDGNWYINGVDSGKKAVGADGTNGTTPEIKIGENGNWYINGVDTEISATGPAGAGCNSTVGIGSLAFGFALIAGAAVVIMLKKKKEQK